MSLALKFEIRVRIETDLRKQILHSYYYHHPYLYGECITIYIVTVVNGCQCQVANGHLGWAYMADDGLVSHLGLGSNV